MARVVTAEAAPPTTVVEAHCDGGVVGSSRSSIGGAAAYLHINADGSYALQAVDAYVPVRTLIHANALLYSSGDLERACQAKVPAGVRVHCYVYPLDTVTNNAMELLALVGCLESLPTGWGGTICSDSMITLGRAFAHMHPGRVTLPHNIRRALAPWRTEGIDPRNVQRLRSITSDMGRLNVRLLDGHPTAEHLASGIGKRGGPVSKHNKYADMLAGRITAVLKATVKDLE